MNKCKNCDGRGAVGSVIMRDPGASGQRVLVQLCPMCKDEIAYSQTILQLFPPETREQRNARIVAESKVVAESLKQPEPPKRRLTLVE